MEFRDLLKGALRPKSPKGVDPYLQAARLSQDHINSPWMAMAKGFPGFRLAGNAVSSRETIAHVLGVAVERVPLLIMDAMNGPSPTKDVPMPKEYRRTDPDDVPFPTYFKGDGGPYVTSGIFHASFGGTSNLSFHRMMHLGSGRFAIRVVPRHLHALLSEAKKDGQDLPACVSIGCDLPSLIAASCSTEYGLDELGIASSIHRTATGGPLKTFRPLKDGPKSPMGSEIVLCGRITHDEAPEGPFVDITGTRDLSGMGGQPVFETDLCLTRKDPIMHVLLPGGMEHFMLMGLPKEPAIMQSVKKVIPTVRAVRLTEGGCCWLHGAVSIRKQKEGDGKNAIMAAFTGHPSMKRVIVVDDDIDIFDDRALEWAVATRFQPATDLVVIEGARGSTLDPSLDPDGTTSKYGMDATMPMFDNSGYRRAEG